MSSIGAPSASAAAGAEHGLPVAVADPLLAGATASAEALVDAEIAAATTARREHPAVTPPGAPGPPLRVEEIVDGLASSFLLQLGCEPDTPLEDVYCIPEGDLLSNLNSMTYLTALQRGKLIRELRGIWEAAGFDAPLLGAPARPRPALPPATAGGPGPTGATAVPALTDHAHGDGPFAGAPAGPAAPSEVAAAARHVAEVAGRDADATGIAIGTLPLSHVLPPGVHAGTFGAAPAGASSASLVPVMPMDAHIIIPQTALVDIPLRRFVDQALEGSAKAFGRDQLDACAARYRAAFDMEPPEDCDPSPEQLAALWHIMSLGLAPYADFAVYNAFGARLNRLTDIDAQILGPGGVLITRRLKAPTTFDAWESCWKLFTASMVSLGAAGIGALDLYLGGIKLAVAQFPGRWELIVATDFLVRSEQWARLRRTFSRTLPAGFDPARPWAYVIAASAYGAVDSPMKEWWNNRFVLPVLTTSSTAAARARIALLDGSAAACGSLAPDSGRRVRSRTPPRRDVNKDKGKQQEQDKDKEICNLWNIGKKPCGGKAQCTFGRLHICKKCKGPHTEDKCDGSGPGDGAASGKRKGRNNRNRRGGAGKA